MNSKINFSKKKQGFDGKKLNLNAFHRIWRTYGRHNQQKQTRRSDTQYKCSLTSIFAFILKLMVQIASIFPFEILLPPKFMAKSISQSAAKTAAKTTGPCLFCRSFESCSFTPLHFIQHCLFSVISYKNKAVATCSHRLSFILYVIKTYVRKVSVFKTTSFHRFPLKGGKNK